MFIAKVPNRSSPPTFLLRESYREGGKVKSRTLANVTHWPREKIELMARVLAGDALVSPSEALVIERSLPHGHVMAVLGTLRKLELDRLISGKDERPCRLVLAMIVARIIDPRSKLATARGLGNESAFDTLGEMLGVTDADADELYAAMDWLQKRQALAPLLFDDEDKTRADAARSSIVAPAQRSVGALRKATKRRTTDNLPVHSFQTLLKDLATRTKNRVRFLMNESKTPGDRGPTTDMLTQPTPLQQRALTLLGLSPSL